MSDATAQQLAAAERAFARGDYATARAQLSAIELEHLDPEARERHQALDEALGVDSFGVMMLLVTGVGILIITAMLFL